MVVNISQGSNGAGVGGCGTPRCPCPHELGFVVCDFHLGGSEALEEAKRGLGCTRDSPEPLKTRAPEMAFTETEGTYRPPRTQ